MVMVTLVLSGKSSWLSAQWLEHMMGRESPQSCHPGTRTFRLGLAGGNHWPIAQLPTASTWSFFPFLPEIFIPKSSSGILPTLSQGICRGPRRRWRKTLDSNSMQEQRVFTAYTSICGVVHLHKMATTLRGAHALLSTARGISGTVRSSQIQLVRQAAVTLAYF